MRTTSAPPPNWQRFAPYRGCFASSVFEEMVRIVYLPPGTPYRIESEAGLRAPVGSAPAEGRYPVRVFEPSEGAQVA